MTGPPVLRQKTATCRTLPQVVGPCDQMAAASVSALRLLRLHVHQHRLHVRAAAQAMQQAKTTASPLNRGPWAQMQAQQERSQSTTHVLGLMCHPYTAGKCCKTCWKTFEYVLFWPCCAELCCAWMRCAVCWLSRGPNQSCAVGCCTK